MCQHEQQLPSPDWPENTLLCGSEGGIRSPNTTGSFLPLDCSHDHIILILPTHIYSLLLPYTYTLLNNTRILKQIFQEKNFCPETMELTGAFFDKKAPSAPGSNMVSKHTAPFVCTAVHGGPQRAQEQHMWAVVPGIDGTSEGEAASFLLPFFPRVLSLIHCCFPLSREKFVFFTSNVFIS